ncbi:LysR family transcriptional regulator [Ruegeria marina]|uniref:DNA-binding transcriptional regulator, LysR family n=1 Tax=Ruegeria marina TaxID=639004 RepID=A0A1G6WU19_9RHOB|nr:LysR family transcriptional regulator [Ruegeria marina]SDD69279.1 DNA-binding transcriptional regulator, LysR family [Ruegeria marina]
MVKIDTLRIFVAVTRHGNLRDAADKVGRTQSALSMALKQLEADLGGPLFETDRKRDLTDLGRFVRDVGEDLVREHDKAIDLIQGYAQGRVGRLRIASVPSVAALILPDLLRAFMEAHEGAQIDLMDSDSSNVRTMVASGVADLGIAGPAPQGQTLEARPLFSDHLHVICRADSVYAQAKAGLSWNDLANAPLIANQTLAVTDLPEAAAIVAKSRLSVRNILSLLAMVRSGIGITLLPGLATRSLDPPLVAIPMTGAGCTRTISLLSRSGRAESPLSRAFRQHLDATIRKVAPDLGLKPRL